MNDIQYGIVLEQSALIRELDNVIKESFFVHDQATNIHLAEFGSTRVLVSCGRASPIVAILIEIFSHLGVRMVFRIATSGSLQEDLREGDIILCTDAVRGEGTSNCYIEPNFPAVADFALTRCLAQELEQQGIPYTLGTIWTTDGRFAETDELIQKYQKYGVSAVDMESSAFFMISKLKGLRAASLSVIADTPWKDLGDNLKGRCSDKVYREKIFPSMQRCLRAVSALLEGGFDAARARHTY